MTNRFLRFVAVTTLVVAMAIMIGCDAKDSARDAEGVAAQGGGGAMAEFGSEKGDLAADFTLKRLDGGELSLRDLQGKAVIVDFWDTWCPPCRRAMPHLQELSETYDEELVVVGVAFGREGEAKVRNYVQSNGLTFEMVLYDPESTILADYGGIQSIPTTFLIDPSGVIREIWVGGADKRSYEKAVAAVVGDKAKAG